MRQIVFEPTFDAWKTAARHALGNQWPPSEILWNANAADPGLDLFAQAEVGPTVANELRPPLKVPRSFLELGRVVALHSDASKWALLYRVLWRLTQGEAKLLEIPTDADVIALNRCAREVHKDAYRMRQYIRFRETQLDGERWFVAWFEPQHDSLQLDEQFFTDRFANMCWSILTPGRCMHWDGEKIRFSAGVAKSAAPTGDDVESLWVTYYSSIFNPARVKVQAMKAQMPVRNWKNLPEAKVIAPLLKSAPQRVHTMIEKSEVQRGRDEDYSLAVPPVTDDWSLLRESADTCRACPLWRNATCTVFGEGPRHARIVLVGEQPGDAEDRAGQPFVGPAGQLLDRALKQAGVDRTQCYVTNAVKHFKWEPRGKRRIHKTPSSRDIAACRPWLEAELTLLKPALIVALGATAARSLLETEIRVTQQRGQILESPFGKTLVTVHPSALVRLPDGQDAGREFERFVSDLRLIGTA